MEHWWIIPFSVTDEQNFSVQRVAVVNNEKAPGALEDFISALGYRGSAADEEIWGTLPAYFEDSVEHSGDNVYYVTGIDFEAYDEDEIDDAEHESILLFVGDVYSRGYQKLDDALASAEEKFPRATAIVVEDLMVIET